MSKDYLRISVNVRDPLQKDILTARLAAIGFEGFEEEPALFRAFIPNALFDPVALEAVMTGLGHAYFSDIIAEKNWNEEWETNFRPVAVGSFCAVRAAFHPPVPGVRYDILVTPKMSFGTGHHATTYLVLEAMEHIPFAGKNVLDFGTGTGVLAILAQKMGAVTVVAIDNDDWSIANAGENFVHNGCQDILLLKAETITGEDPFDIILANINRNVIMAAMGVMKQHLATGGVLLLSGLLVNDREVVLEEAGRHGLQLLKFTERGGWICISLAAAPVSQ